MAVLKNISFLRFWRGPCKACGGSRRQHVFYSVARNSASKDLEYLRIIAFASLRQQVKAKQGAPRQIQLAPFSCNPCDANLGEASKSHDSVGDQIPRRPPDPIAGHPVGQSACKSKKTSPCADSGVGQTTAYSGKGDRHRKHVPNQARARPQPQW